MTRRFIHIVKPASTAVLSLFAFFMLAACDGGKGAFSVDGRFRNFNNGEFYIYCPDDVAGGLDTIKVADGRFSYETELHDKETFVILFPNFSEMAVFAEPGGKVRIEGDASHLKEMEVKGTDDNERMTKFRQNVNRLSPPEATREAASFIKENPASPISVYLLRRYFLQTTNPDYTQAAALLTTMEKAAPDNGRIQKLRKQIDKLKGAALGQTVGTFNATATNGQRVSKATLSAKVNVVNVWATWNFDSQKIQRDLAQLKKSHGSDIAIISICLDASQNDCKRSLDRDSIKWANVCDGRMWDTPLLGTFGLSTVSGNIVADKAGKVVARNLNAQQLREKIEALLKSN